MCGIVSAFGELALVFRRFFERNAGVWPLPSEDGTLALRPISDHDLEAVEEWFRDLELVRFAFGYDNVSDGELERTAVGFVERTRRYKRNSFAILDADDEIIGVTRFDSRTTYEGNVALVGIMLGRACDRGRGLGSKALRLFLKYLFETVKVDSVEMETAVYNTQASRSFQKVGFELCERLVSIEGIDPDDWEPAAAPKLWLRFPKSKWFAQS